MSDVGGRVWRALLGWLVVVGGVALAVHPERCTTPEPGALRAAASAAVDWFGANTRPDGRFVYRYDRDRAVEEGGYNDVRHAGVLFSLFQAAGAGIAGALDIGDDGLDYVDANLTETAVGVAFGRGIVVETGTQGLLVAALDERRAATGSTDRDELMLELGRTMVGAVTPEGAVAASIHVVDGPGDDRSPFFTGEVLWALARLHLVFPDEGFDSAALRIRRYLVEDRDRVEEPWPPVSDHWGAYAFETMSRWPDPPALGDAERRWLDRQLALFGLQVRYESQRQGGITRLTRGPIALAAGVGTLGEGLGNHLRLVDRTGVAASTRHDLIDRATCAAGLLVTRQVSDAEASTHPEPERVAGAWFRLGDTQMDDQQHALSALLLLEGVIPT